MAAPQQEIAPSFPVAAQVKMPPFSSDLMLTFPNEEPAPCIPQNQMPPFQTTVISKNNNKLKHITQQHIKLTSDQAQSNVYKQPMNYSPYTMNDISSKSASVINPSPQNIGVVAQTERNRRYKFNLPIQPSYKFTAQPTSNEYMIANRPQITQQIIPVRTDNVIIQVSFRNFFWEN